ncbi:hypothetical protein K438DRAFT_1960187 [Mycena galopus ATCC 62051]|nr:hypothetical protein K438DRAFT_1960187 [Mycena galopus ATCC 62051]
MAVTTKKRTTRSAKSTPTANAATLPGSTTTPARSALDAPTDKSLSSPTPDPRCALSCQGSILPATDVPPVPNGGTAATHGRSLLLPPSFSLPFSSMVARAAEMVHLRYV